MERAVKRVFWLTPAFLTIILLSYGSLTTFAVNYTSSKIYFLKHTSSVELNLLWTLKTESNYYSAPYITDIDGDYKPDVIIAKGSRILCISLEGEIIYSFEDENASFIVSPAIADLNKDGTLEIVIPSFRMLYCLTFKEGALTVSWKKSFDINFDGRSSPLLADVDKDGFLEIIIPDKETVYCLDYKGDIIWTFSQDDAGISEIANYFSTVTVNDLDSDGQLELLIETRAQYLFCLNSGGQLIWKVTQNGSSSWTSIPFVTDLDLDGDQEILYSKASNLYCLNVLGNIKWAKSWQTSSYFDLDPFFVAYDINGDGKKEIVLNIENQTTCLDYQDNISWVFQMDKVSYTQPIISDFDGNGFFEILISCGDGSLYFLDYKGNLLWTYQTNDSILVSPCIADLNLDGKLELVVCTDDGTIYCLGLQGINQSGITGWWGEASTPFRTNNIDGDGDYLDDITESYYGTDLTNDDTDGDALKDGYETQIFHSDPLKNDTDADKLNDAEEVLNYGTNPSAADTDFDGLSDYDEIFVYNTNPLEKDTDKDGLNDGWEIKYHFNPLKWDNWPLFWHNIPFIVVIVIFLGSGVYAYTKTRPLIPKVTGLLKRTKKVFVNLYYTILLKMLKSGDRAVKRAEIKLQEKR